MALFFHQICFIHCRLDIAQKCMHAVYCKAGYNKAGALQSHVNVYNDQKSPLDATNLWKKNNSSASQYAKKSRYIIYSRTNTQSKSSLQFALQNKFEIHLKISPKLICVLVFVVFSEQLISLRSLLEMNEKARFVQYLLIDDWNATEFNIIIFV